MKSPLTDQNKINLHAAFAPALTAACFLTCFGIPAYIVWYAINDPYPGSKIEVHENDLHLLREDTQTQIQQEWDQIPGKDSPVSLSFMVCKDGQLSEVHILESSGSPEIDQSAITSIQRAAPFKPLGRYLQDKHELACTMDPTTGRVYVLESPAMWTLSKLKWKK